METMAWGSYALDKDLINTKLERIDMYKAPVDVTLKQKVSNLFMQQLHDGKCDDTPFVMYIYL